MRRFQVCLWMLILLILRQPEAEIYPDTKSLLMQEKCDAWSGGDNWKDVKVVEAITKWVYEGGCFIELASHQQPVDMIRFSDWHRYWA